MKITVALFDSYGSRVGFADVDGQLQGPQPLYVQLEDGSRTFKRMPATFERCAAYSELGDMNTALASNFRLNK